MQEIMPNISGGFSSEREQAVSCECCNLIGSESGRYFPILSTVLDKSKDLNKANKAHDRNQIELPSGPQP